LQNHFVCRGAGKPHLVISYLHYLTPFPVKGEDIAVGRDLSATAVPRVVVVINSRPARSLSLKESSLHVLAISFAYFLPCLLLFLPFASAFSRLHIAALIKKPTAHGGHGLDHPVIWQPGCPMEDPWLSVPRLLVVWLE